MSPLLKLWILTVFFSLTPLFSSATPFNGYIVKLKDHTHGPSSQSLLRTWGAIEKSVDTSFGQFVLLKTESPLSKMALQSLNQNPAVAYVEPNYLIHVRKQIKFIEIPKDEHFERQWGLHNELNSFSLFSTPNNSEDLNMLRAWPITKGRAANPIKIAVIDSGIDYRHPDLAEQMDTNTAELHGQTGVDDDANGFIDDIYGYDFANNDGDPMDGSGHGTHCAGVIGAQHNGIGIAGVMAHVRLIGLKFLSDQGEGQEFDAIRAIDYAIKRGARVLSNSWGGPDRIQALEDAISEANKQGISFVAAAGNDSANNDHTASFPANFKVENVISVGSFEYSGKRSDFSNFGTQSVHVMAPGTDIYSTSIQESYEYLSGTSMATPHIAGVIGLLLSLKPELTPSQIKAHLIATSQKTDALSVSSRSGGRVDAFRALSEPLAQTNDAANIGLRIH